LPILKFDPSTISRIADRQHLVLLEYVLWTGQANVLIILVSIVLPFNNITVIVIKIQTYV